mgnify:CR=1 FL=1
MGSGTGDGVGWDGMGWGGVGWGGVGRGMGWSWGGDGDGDGDEDGMGMGPQTPSGCSRCLLNGITVGSLTSPQPTAP